MKKRGALPYALLLVLTVLLAWIVSTWHYQLMLIHGDSMLPTYRSGELVLLQKQPSAYVRGDVVLCRVDTLERSVVKRIAGVPGDTLTAIDGELLINGVYAAPLPDADRLTDALADSPLTLGPGQYFLLGDNLPYSIDSRFAQVGPVTVDQLRGRVLRQR